MASWASRRKTLLVFIGLGFAVAIGILIAIPFVFKLPSCTDGKQNQGEAGIDCGGSCAYLCSTQASPPSVRFARALVQAGRTDVVAYIDNRNQEAAAKDIPYTIEVYDADRVLIGKREGVIDLAPGMTTPVFVSGIQTGGRIPAQAFVVIEDERVRWYAETERPEIPAVRSAQIDNGLAPRIIALLANATPRPFLNTVAVVTVYDSSNNVIAASRTIVDTVPAGGEAQAVFTWPNAFEGVAVRVEVLPVPVP